MSGWKKGSSCFVAPAVTLKQPSWPVHTCQATCQSKLFLNTLTWSVYCQSSWSSYVREFTNFDRVTATAHDANYCGPVTSPPPTLTWEIDYTTGVYVPYPFQTAVWVLLCPLPVYWWHRMKENVTPPLVAIERCFDAPRSTYKLSRLISIQFL